MPGSRRVKIIKRTSSKRDSDYQKFARVAIGYQPWKSPDLKTHGVYKRFYDTFSCKLPDKLYKVYQPIREEYAHLAKMEIKKQLKLRSTLGRLTNLKLESRLRRLEKEEEKIRTALDKELSNK